MHSMYQVIKVYKTDGRRSSIRAVSESGSVVLLKFQFRSGRALAESTSISTKIDPHLVSLSEATSSYLLEALGPLKSDTLVFSGGSCYA